MATMTSSFPHSTISASSYSAASTFDELGKRYDLAFGAIPAQLRSLEWASSQLSTVAKHGQTAKVLDVGCGTGKPASAMLADAGHAVHGVDIAPKMIDVAKSQVANATFEVADSRTWKPPLPLGSYDGVVAYFSFITGMIQADIHAFFPRAYSWLRPGGVFVFATVPVAGENVAIKWMGRDVVVSSLSAEETAKGIRDAGFVIEKEESEAYLPPAVEVGLCKEEDVWEEPMFYIYARKPV